MMLNIDFYILNKSETWLHELCNLVETTYTTKNNIYIYSNSQEEAEKLDAFLWIYKDISFLPHKLCLATDNDYDSIGIGLAPAPPFYQEILINLTTTIPAFYTQFKQVIELVLPDPTAQQLARERYRQYRAEGHFVNTHKITK